VVAGASARTAVLVDFVSAPQLDLQTVVCAIADKLDNSFEFRRDDGSSTIGNAPLFISQCTLLI
jgi:hypothetical protein